MYKNINGSFLYFINYQDNERELCKMEMRCLFNREINEKYFFSDIDINASKSPFIKSKIKIIYSDESLDRMVSKIKEDNLSYDDFKVSYVKSEQGDVQYEDRLEATRKIGFVVNGYPDMHKPRNPLAVTKINGLWIFGEYERNDFKWQKHNDKPYSYSNALGLRMARALVNIAMKDNEEGTLIDPCCGVGTVVIEASASPEGTTKFNQKLSEDRANAVKSYLESRGVKVTKATGLGVVGNESNRIAIVTVQ